MKTSNKKSTILRSITALLLAQIASGGPIEQRAYTLAGYIPKFYIELADPFDERTEDQLKKYRDGVVSYLKTSGIEARAVEFNPRSNVLILSDTPENLEQYEVALRGIFTPDMQLKTIDAVTEMLANPKLMEIKLEQISILDEITFRAFHGEVRKLEDEAKILPMSHEEERKVIEARLAIAKKYRESALKLYLKSLSEQKKLIEDWQKETTKTQQAGADQPATKPADKVPAEVKPSNPTSKDIPR